jgi:uncharacterized protein YlxW (UPF0749 family)
MLPRRYFGTASTHSTDDIVRTRDAFNTKLIDANDVAGAEAVKDIINMQDELSERITSNTGILDVIGTYDEFEVSFDAAK